MRPSVLYEPDGQCVIFPGKLPQYHVAFLAATCCHRMVHVSVYMNAVKIPASTIIAAKSAAQPHCAFQLVMCSWPSMLQLCLVGAVSAEWPAWHATSLQNSGYCSGVFDDKPPCRNCLGSRDNNTCRLACHVCRFALLYHKHSQHSAAHLSNPVPTRVLGGLVIRGCISLKLLLIPENCIHRLH